MKLDITDMALYVFEQSKPVNIYVELGEDSFKKVLKKAIEQELKRLERLSQPRPLHEILSSQFSQD